jgi:hypothetical protein
MKEILKQSSLVNLSFRGSHLCTPDPSVSSILPIDDDAWDQGVSNLILTFVCFVHELKDYAL